jgi:hypothetical protein
VATVPVGHLADPAAACVTATVRVAVTARMAMVVVILLAPSGALLVELPPPRHFVAPVACVSRRSHGAQAQAGIPRSRANQDPQN